MHFEVVGDIGNVETIANKDCDDLEKGKVCCFIPDDEAEKEGYLRIVDESGEDYLYPESYFVLVDLPQKAQRGTPCWRKHSDPHTPNNLLKATRGTPVA